MTYWSEKEEISIRNYIETEDTTKRNLIYTKELHKPLNLLIRGVIYGKQFNRLTIETKEDIFYECQSLIFELITKFNPDKQTKAFNYLTTCTYNYVRQLLNNRNNKTIIYRELYDSEEIDESGEVEDAITENESRIIMLNNALFILEDHERIIYDMYFVQSKTQSEIADKIGIGSASIYKIIRNLRVKLKTHLGATSKMHRCYSERKK